MMNEILKELALAAILALIAILGTVGTAVLSKFKAWIVAKTDGATYNAALEFAKGLYLFLEDKYVELGIRKAGELKRADMEMMLHEKFPSLTQGELDAINKEIWAAFNMAIGESGVLEPVNTDNDDVVEVEETDDTETPEFVEAVTE